jgi:Antitoxin of toxin-antitoxin, RelE / RelB, TA system
MTARLVPTIDFSPAKAHLSDVMDAVFHQHRLQVISRHRGKEQMLLVRPEDLVAMLADQRLEVLAVYDGGEITLRVPELGVLGFGDTLDEAIADLLADVRLYVARFFENPAPYMAGRGTPPLALLRFALSPEGEQRSVLGIDEPAIERELVGAR